MSEVVKQKPCVVCGAHGHFSEAREQEFVGFGKTTVVTCPFTPRDQVYLQTNPPREQPTWGRAIELLQWPSAPSEERGS